MGKKSRTKGACGELEVCGILRDSFPEAARELDQYQGKLGRDLKGCQPWCVQVKRKKKMSETEKEDALYEATSACGSDGFELPIVFYREDHKRWRVFTSMDVLLQSIDGGAHGPEDWELNVDMDAEQFMAWIKP